jgi:hypothetical protein
MSVQVRGTLIVQAKKGRKGEFKVADLATEIGEFEVKDALIEEFEPGSYTGDFIIKWIEPDSFSWRGRVFVKNRATLEAIYVDDVDEVEPSAQAGLPPERDPADTHEAPAASSAPQDQPAMGTGTDPAITASTEGSPVTTTDPTERSTAPTRRVVTAKPEVIDTTPSGDTELFGADLMAMLDASVVFDS